MFAVGCAALIAACGSAGSAPGPAAPTGSAAAVAFSDCMRSHGVPDFPDPLPTGGFPRGAGAQTPASGTARKACSSILRSGQVTQLPTEADRAALLGFARCMRAHGVPDFPDPVTRSQVPRNTNVLVQGSLMFPLASTIDPGSPAFQRAGDACGQRPPSGQPKGG